MKTGLSAGLLAHYAAGSYTLATCWKITLTNGTVVASTSHVDDIVYDGVTYQSVASYLASDVQTSHLLEIDNLELEGQLVSPAITEEALQAGLWDYASFEWFEVNYNDLTMGRNLLRSGTLGEIKIDSSTFRTELRGLTQHLTRRIGRLITETCPWTLGDARCTKSLAAFTRTGVAVATVTDARRTFTMVTAGEAVDHYTYGKVTWLTGLNAGLSSDVKRSQADGTVTLMFRTPYDIVIADTFTIVAGCAKRYQEDCIDKFANGVNFGGYPMPWFPGVDIYRGPDRT